MQGVELEKTGKVFEAMRMYRRAVHIDADIEFKMYDKLKQSIHLVNKTVEADTKTVQQTNVDDDENAEDLSSVDLVARFQTSIANGNGNLFNRDNAAQGVIITDGLHISSLPIEIILYILRWVVSSNLDLRSLEQCAMACKGFYLCARDPDIWRLACFKYAFFHISYKCAIFLFMFLKKKFELFEHFQSLGPWCWYVERIQILFMAPNVY